MARATISSSRTARLRNRQARTETIERTSVSMPGTLRRWIPKLQTLHRLWSFQQAEVFQQPAKTPLLRCAIYTRKSSEEGREQDFNSLHAQRGACEAFIKSRAGEGWRLVK